MRYFFIFLLICLCVLYGLSFLKLPPILLPKGAHHNTIGIIPLLKVPDSGGNFEPIWSCEDSCTGSVQSYCDGDYYIFNNNQPIHRKRTIEEKKNCKEEAYKICHERCPPNCEALARIGSIWTCYDGVHGGTGWE